MDYIKIITENKEEIIEQSEYEYDFEETDNELIVKTKHTFGNDDFTIDFETTNYISLEELEEDNDLYLQIDDEELSSSEIDEEILYDNRIYNLMTEQIIKDFNYIEKLYKDGEI